MRRRRRPSWPTAALWLLGMLVVVAWAAPFVWMVVTSIKPPGEIMTRDVEWIPRHVTLPLLRPAFSLVITLLVIGTLRVFSQIYVMTNGGPANASASVILYVYRVGFQNGELGYAAALSSLLFVTILVVTAVELRVLRSRRW